MLQRWRTDLAIAVAGAMMIACSDGTDVSRPVPTTAALGDRPTRLYWAEGSTGTSSEPGSIAVAIGTEVRHGLVTGTTGRGGVAVDDEHVYWANHGDGTIGRADLDGSQINQRFITGADDPVGVALDDEYIYWTNSAFSKEDNDFEETIGRARLDGSEATQRFIVATRGPLQRIAGLAVDRNLSSILRRGLSSSSVRRCRSWAC